MKTTPKERAEVIQRLSKLGIDYETACQLRRISNTLSNWFELECGTGDSRVSYSIEREENGDGKPFVRIQYQGLSGWIDERRPIPDREAGAKRRLEKIMAPLKDKLVPYIQGDCRGASLYILRREDVRNGESLDSIYTRGVAVY